MATSRVNKTSGRARILTATTLMATLLHGLALAGMPWLLSTSSPLRTAEQGITIELAPASPPPLPALPEPSLPVAEPESTTPQKAKPSEPQKYTAPKKAQRAARPPKTTPAVKTPQQKAAVPQVMAAQPSATYDNPKPVYPELARKRGQEGTVRLLAHVDEEGRVITVEVDQSSGWSMLDAAALKTVRRWRFQPAMRAGIAVRSTVMVPVRFALR